MADDDSASTSASAPLTVHNLAPVVRAGPAGQTGYAGASTSFNLGTFSDAGVLDNPWTVDVNWGDGSGDTTFTVNSRERPRTAAVWVAGQPGGHLAAAQFGDDVAAAGAP